MILLILCLLAIFACVAIIFGRDTAQRGVSLTLGLTGAVVFYFVQACVWIGLIALAFLLPPIGVPLLLVALLVKYVLPFALAVAKGKKERAVSNGDQEETRKKLYLAERKVEQLRQTLERADNHASIYLCKDLSQDEGWHLALPALQDGLASPRAETRLCAVHGLRHIYNAQMVQRLLEGDATFDAAKRQIWHNSSFKPNLVREVTEMLSSCATNHQEETRVRVAAVIAIGNAAFVEAYGTVLELLRDKNNDVRAAACRAAFQFMYLKYPALLTRGVLPIPSTRWRDDIPPTPEDWSRQTATALYQSYFSDLVDALGSHQERLVLEALSAACIMVEVVVLSAGDLDGLIRVMQNLSMDSRVSVKVHDAADEAIKALRMTQQNQQAHRG